MGQRIYFNELSDELRIRFPKPVNYKIYVGDGILFEVPGKPPNRFHRWAMRKTFGWRFTDADGKSI